MNEIVIVAAKRTAVGRFAGSLANVSAPELGATVIRRLLKDTGIESDQVDEVILGQVLTAGAGQNPARQAALSAGIPESIPAMTINKVCGSGLKAVALAAQSIIAGDNEIVIAGGQENMSASGHFLANSRNGQRLGDWKLQDIMIRDGLSCAMHDIHMGITAENIAKKFAIGREEQDIFATASQNKAERAQSSGRFADEIVPVEVPQKRAESIIFDQDEHLQKGATLEKTQRLRPAFSRDGTVTAANASGINDGAAAVMVMTASKADELGLQPMASIVNCSSAGVDPLIMGTGPITATKRCLQRSGWDISDLELIESNEAFAVQAISVNKALQWNTELVNVNGGAIALGHPIGASGARVLVTLLHEMIKRNVNKGLATLCIGGGMGIAMTINR